MDEMPIANQRYDKVYALNQTRNNTQLAVGVGSLLGVLWWAQLQDLMPVSKRYEKLMKSLQSNRQFNDFISEAQPLALPSFSVQYVNHDIKKVEDENIKEDHDDMDTIEIGNVKKSPKGWPESVQYLIVGGGTAAFAAYRSIKAHDPTAKILIISEEKATPYMRPPLTKELWYFDKNHKSESELMFKSFSGRERNLYFEKEAFYTPVDSIEFNPKGGVAIMKGVKVSLLDPDQNTVQLEDGRRIKYDKCLLATGGRPKVPKAFEQFKNDSRVTTFRTVQDFELLEAKVKSGAAKSIVIVGGGFLGTELASSLEILGKDIDLQVTQIFPEKGNLAKILPPYLSKWATKNLNASGVVTVHASKNVSKVTSEPSETKLKLELDSGEVIKGDHVVIATGIEPSTELAAAAGLSVDPNVGGFAVNEELQAKENIYVAGDAAAFLPSPQGLRIRHEHHDNALVTGKIAGENMATGSHKTVTVNPMFWSDMGHDIGVEGIGLIDNNLETVGVYVQTKKENEYVKGVVFYKDDQDRVVGVLLWNVFNQMSTARRIVNENKKYDDLMEVAKLFNLYGVKEDMDGEEG